jgi:hypothetical protein
MNVLPPLLERDVTRQVTGFLRAHRWRLIRMNVTTLQLRGQWVRFGETGIPDYLALYYLPDSLAVVLWLEFKRERKGKLRREQELWHAREKKDGAVICTVTDYDTFREFYAAQFDRPDSPVKGQRELIGAD